jgi:hypothetical protein
VVEFDATGCLITLRAALISGRDVVETGEQ